jgi:dimethyl sulfoxide reductase membrane subunit
MAEDRDARNEPGQFPLLRRRGGYPLLLGLTVVTFACCTPWHVAPALTGIRDHSVGALYVVNFVFFIGASAGAVIVGTVAGASGIARLRPVVHAAELGAAAGFLLASLFLALALAGSGVSWPISSGYQAIPSMWSLTIIGLYLGNAMALGYFGARHELVRWVAPLRAARTLGDIAALVHAALTDVRARSQPGLLPTLAVILIPSAVLLHAVPAWIIPAPEHDTGWSIVASGGLLYVSTIISGLALVVLAASVGQIVPGRSVGNDLAGGLAGTLALATPVLGFCVFAETHRMIEASGASGAHLFHELVLGPYAPLFWFVQVAGVIVPSLVLMLPGASTPIRTGLAALLVVLGTLVERWNLLVPPLLGHAHVFYTSGGYRPAPHEVLATLAVYVLALVAGRPLARRLVGAGG